MVLRRLILIRHGETDYTREGRFCGSDDPALTEHGVVCAHRLADRLALDPPDMLLSSPARRALDTAFPAAERTQRRILSLPGLAETRFGDWEGRRYDEVHDTLEHRLWTENPAVHAPPGGETGNAVLARALAAIEPHLPAADDIAIFSHKGTIRLLLSHFLKLPAPKYRHLPDIPPASVSEIWVRKGEVVRSVFGSTAHLQGGDRAETAPIRRGEQVA